MAAACARDPRPLLHTAVGDARRLERERMPCPAAMARLIRAGVAAVRGDSRAVDLLAEAAACFEAVDMRLCAAAARRRRGELSGGDEGSSLIADADAWMAGQGIRNPARMTDLYAPGFGRPSRPVAGR